MRRRGVLLLMALASVIALRPAHGQREAWIERLPTVHLEGLDPAVAEQLSDAREWTVATWSSEGSTNEERLERLWDLSVAWHAYELFEAAEDGYVLGAELAPAQERWTYAAGVLAADRGDFETAARRFRLVIDRLPGSVLPSLRLGLSLRELNRNEEARDLLLQVLQAEPDNLAALAALGEISVANGEFEDGIDRLQRVLERVPDANRLQYSLALAYRGLGDQVKAREHLSLRGVVGIRPEDPFRDEIESTARGERLSLIRGREAFRAARFEEARQLFDQALVYAPGSVRALTDRAAALAALGDYDQATADLEHALTLDPNSLTARFNLGRLHFHTGDDEGAVILLKGVVAEAPKDLEARRLLGKSLTRSRRYGEAIAVLRTMVALDSTDEDAHLDLAESQLQVGLYREGKETLESAHSLLPKSGLVTHALARFLAAVPDRDLRDGKRAAELAQLVYTASPTVSHAETMAMALAELGRCEDATAWQTAAIDGAFGESSQERLTAMGDRLRKYSSTAECRP